jgi:hypothetical protein
MSNYIHKTVRYSAKQYLNLPEELKAKAIKSRFVPPVIGRMNDWGVFELTFKRLDYAAYEYKQLVKRGKISPINVQR